MIEKQRKTRSEIGGSVAKNNRDSHFSPLEVIARNDEPIEKLIKRFTKKVRADGVLQEFFERQHYDKPSVKRRHKESRARFNAKVQLVDEE